ncbi:hypothetical protein JSQ81_10135 [Sporosarcina sp. Marseille-Q4063]|uniref:hypothetical protein n=1 Tax=Sporosarcina sp. Marseille-Q4063 TaxID=2810514 RepID=UPI001BAEDCCE|nr:hypothetical protein [Sporosarcina sp. Marseille-Q4063]QUW23813.1 hypothetical protein JSQ81_10135 [Sporosarcina sp. Marseille-Q4063]
MKRILLFSALLLTLTLSACSNDLMISERILTDEESILISNSGGGSADHFEIIGQIPNDYELYFMIEQYEKGEFIQNKIAENPVNLDTEDRTVSFAVNTYGDEGEIVFGSPGGAMKIEAIKLQGGSSSAKTFEGKNPIKPDEPVYLAYWYSESGDTMLGADGELEDIKSRELSYLFKAELKKK